MIFGLRIFSIMLPIIILFVLAVKIALGFPIGMIMNIKDDKKGSKIK